MYDEKRVSGLLRHRQEWFLWIKRTPAGCSARKGPWGDHIQGVSRDKKEAMWLSLGGEKGQEVGVDYKSLARDQIMCTLEAVKQMWLYYMCENIDWKALRSEIYIMKEYS